MTRQSSALFALVAVALLVAPVGAVAAQDGGAAGNASTTDGNFTLAELKQDGEHVDVPSVRLGDRTQFWLVYWPASNPFAEVGSSEGGEYLPERHTVGRNQVYLRTWAYEDRVETVHLVYWTEGTRTVQRGNATTEQQVATNVTHVTQQVTIERGRPTVEIPLAQHDTPVRVTMWIEGHEWARWTFSHHSVATTQAVNIDSEGDYLTELFTDFLWVVLPGLPLVGLLGRKAIDRAYRGPYAAYTPWIIGFVVCGGLAVATLYESLAELVVAAPQLIGVSIVVLVGIVLVETWTNNVSEALFLQPKLEHSTSPTGEDAYDIVGFEAETHTVVSTGSGAALLKDGLLGFFARIWGKVAHLEQRGWLADSMRRQTRILSEHSSADELYLVDPEADSVVEYEAEGWTLSFPELRAHPLPYIAVVGAAAVGYVLVQGAYLSAPMAAGGLVAGVLAWGATPTDGAAGYVPAPPHFRQAFGTVATLIEGYSDAQTIEEAKDELDRERISKHQDVESEIEQRDATLIREMEGGEIPATIRGEGGHDDVVDEEDDGIVERDEPADAAADGGEAGGE